MALLKTMVGSLPPQPLPPEEAIRLAVELQLKLGLDILTDGEPRADMILYFEQIPGLGRLPRHLFVEGRITPMEDPSSFIKVHDYEYLRTYLEGLGRAGVPVKTTITGPLTLGIACVANGVKAYYSGVLDERLYLDLAEALKPLVTTLLRRGSLVQIDEPTLSQWAMETNQAMRLLDLILEDLPTTLVSQGMVSMHVCGGLTRELVSRLTRLNLSTLSFGFSRGQESGNHTVLSRRELEENGVKIGVGCVPVQALSLQEVEPIPHIVKRLHLIKEVIGVENFAYIHPDCGLRGTPLPVAEEILRNMVSSAKAFEEVES